MIPLLHAKTGTVLAHKGQVIDGLKYMGQSLSSNSREVRRAFFTKPLTNNVITLIIEKVGTI